VFIEDGGEGRAIKLGRKTAKRVLTAKIAKWAKKERGSDFFEPRSKLIDSNQLDEGIWNVMKFRVFRYFRG
jgi:hypothetical protein